MGINNLMGFEGVSLTNIDLIKALVREIEKEQDRLDFNEQLFNLLENDMMTPLKAKLQDDLTVMWQQALKRVAPINLFRRLVDKLAVIYQQDPWREVTDGTEQDKELLSWYERGLNINDKMNFNDEYYSAFDYSLLQITQSDGKPFVRTIPNHHFLVFSTDPTDHTKVDIVMLLMGKDLDDNYIFWLYSNDEFIIADTGMGGRLRPDLMARFEIDGTNPYGTLPFVYVNRSQNLVMPKIQKDNLQMSLLIPILWTDLNFAVKFQAFSIIYGIDINDEGLTFDPNVFWKFFSDPATDKTPQIGSIKPQVDIAQVIPMIGSQFSMWLNSKGIKPGAVGDLNIESFASGISKMIDEMDTIQVRKRHVSQYTVAEGELWDKIFNFMHPFWVSQGMVENTHQMSVDATVITHFQPQIPLADRGDLVRDLKDEVEAGFTTTKRAIKALNPHMTEAEIDELQDEIDQDEMIVVEESGENELPDTDKEVEVRASGTTAAGVDVQVDPAQSLNGAQVTSLLQIVEQVSLGTLPKDSGKAIAKTSFNLSDDQLNDIFDPIEVREQQDVNQMAEGENQDTDEVDSE